MCRWWNRGRGITHLKRKKASGSVIYSTSGVSGGVYPHESEIISKTQQRRRVRFDHIAPLLGVCFHFDPGIWVSCISRKFVADLWYERSGYPCLNGRIANDQCDV